MFKIMYARIFIIYIIHIILLFNRRLERASGCSAHHCNTGGVGRVQLPSGLPCGPPRPVRTPVGEEGRRNGRQTQDTILIISLYRALCFSCCPGGSPSLFRFTFLYLFLESQSFVTIKLPD